MIEYWNQFQEVFGDVLTWIADHLTFLGTHQWAGAIVLLTLVVRTAMLPLAIKQIRSSQAMQRLQPELKRLQTKFRDDRQKLNEEMMALYRREGVNPFAGCLPVIAQMPIFIGMFYAIRKVSSVEGAQMPFLGLGDLVNTASSSAAGIILLGIMVASQYVSTKQITAGQTGQQAKMMRIMPFLFVGFMIRFPAALVLYWAMSNVYQLVQQSVMLRGRVQAQPPKAGGKREKKATQQPRERVPDKPQQRAAAPHRPAARKGRPPVRTKPRSKRR